MKHSITRITAAALLLFVGAASADEISIFVFKSGQSVPGASVVLDRQPLGRTDMDGALTAEIAAGNHTLEITEPGGLPVEFGFDTAAGESIEIGVRLGGRQAQFAATRFQQGQESTATGMLAGQVVDPTTGAGIPGAEITVSGAAVTTTSDVEGGFSLELPRGVYDLRISHPDYATRIVREQRVVASMQLAAVISLAAPGQDGPIEEVVAVASYIADTPIEVERRSDSVLDVISAEDIAIAGDANAAAALKRVTGLTVSEGKFVFVRGLGERYSQTLLNGSEIPSPDPTRRIIPLDLFPTGVLGELKIQKSYTPDMPGDFSGGVVQLSTRSIPDDFIATVGASLGGNTETTGETGLTQDNDDFFGFDDGSRDLPFTIRQLTQNGALNLAELTDAEREAAGESLRNDYNANAEELGSDFGFDGMMGDRIEMDGASFGYRAALMYDNSWNRRFEFRREFGLDGSGGLVVRDDAVQLRTEQTIDLGAMLNLSYEYGDADSIDSTTLISRQTNNGTFYTQGYFDENDRDQAELVLEWVETQLFSQQFRGSHLFADKGGLELDWHATFSTAKREEPDTREIRWARTDSSDPFQLAATIDLGRNPIRRTWEFLDEDATDLGVDLMYPWLTDHGQEWEIKAGVQTTSRDRDSEIFSYRFDLPSPPPANLGDDLAADVEFQLTADRIGPGQWTLSNGNLASDSYGATHDIDSLYLMADTWWNEEWRTQFGFRYESSDIEVGTFQLFNPAALNVTRLDDGDFLPAINVTWAMDDERQMRFGLSKTVNRPQLRELSPTPFTDPETRYVRIGNTNLQQADILNLDARYEHYWSGDEGYSIAFFYKDFKDPIEQIISGGGSGGQGVYTFDNVESARNMGIEFEYRQGLDRFFDNEYLSRMYVMGNVTFIDSQVSIDPAQAGIVTSLERELQGQSPWIFNGMIGYRDDRYQLDAALLLNVFGERITNVGQKGLPDIVQQPTPTLDFTVTKGFGDRWKVKFKAQNMLDPEYEYLQGDGVQRSYYKGADFSISGEYTF